MAMIRYLSPLLALSCLSEPVGDSNRPLEANNRVRFVGGDSRAVAPPASSCNTLRECCEGDPSCLDFVDTLSEVQCADLLDGAASECLVDDCCQADDPCGWEDDGSCDCPGEFWDENDCGGGVEAEAEAEAEPECCSPSDPCDLADDGWCDCPGEPWEEPDCGIGPPDAGPAGDF